jgi:uncharacterized membrane protein YhhN
VLPIALTVTLLVCLTNWWACWQGHRTLEAVSKPVATVGAIWVAVAADGPEVATVGTVVALVLCLMGDISLLPQVDRFVVGLASFLLAHVAFILVFANLGFERWWQAGLAIVLVAMIMGSAAIPIVRQATARGLGLPVKAYLAVISLMCIAGYATGNPLVVVGVTSFVLSDTILGFRRFVVERHWQQPAIMITYHAALLCLAGALAIA